MPSSTKKLMLNYGNLVLVFPQNNIWQVLLMKYLQYQSVVTQI